MENYKNDKLIVKWKLTLPKCDKLIGESAQIVISHNQASASLLQRVLKVGYNRAGKLIDTLEELDIIGPFTGSAPKKILINESELKIFLEIIENIVFYEDVIDVSSDFLEVEKELIKEKPIVNELLELKNKYEQGIISKEKYEELKLILIYK